MNNKRTMTLNLSDQEMIALSELAATKDMSKTAVIKQALRVYQLVDARLCAGEQLFSTGLNKKKTELLLVM